MVRYEHACAACAHVVCHHYYEFTVRDDASVVAATRHYNFMDCLLCGHGNSVVHVPAEASPAVRLSHSRCTQFLLFCFAA